MRSESSYKVDFTHINIFWDIRKSCVKGTFFFESKCLAYYMTSKSYDHVHWMSSLPQLFSVQTNFQISQDSIALVRSLVLLGGESRLLWGSRWLRAPASPGDRLSGLSVAWLNVDVDSLDIQFSWGCCTELAGGKARDWGFTEEPQTIRQGCGMLEHSSDSLAFCQRWRGSSRVKVIIET